MKRFTLFILVSFFVVVLMTGSSVSAESISDLRYKAYDLYADGNSEEAIQIYDQAIDQAISEDPDWLCELYNAKSMIFRELEQYEEADAVYDQMLALDSEIARSCIMEDIWYNKAEGLQNLGKLEEAVESYEQGISAQKEKYGEVNPYYLGQKGLTLMELGRNQEAIETFDEALAIDPDSSEIQDAREKANAATTEIEAGYNAKPQQSSDSQGSSQPPVNGCVKYDSGTTTSYSCDCSNYATMCQKKYFYQEKDGKLEKTFETEAVLPEGYFHGCCGDKWIEVPIDLPTEEPTEKPVEEEQVIENSGEIAVGSIFTGVYEQGVRGLGSPLYTKDATIVINERDELDSDTKSEYIPFSGTITFSDDFTFDYGREVPSGTPLDFRGAVYHFNDSGTVSIAGQFYYPGEEDKYNGYTFGNMVLPDDAW